MNLVQEARHLVQNLDQRMGPSPYDTAWAARVRHSGVRFRYEHRDLDSGWRRCRLPRKRS